MRRDLFIIVVVLMTSVLYSCSRGHRSENEKSNKVVHLSLDDVEVIGDLIRHQQDYDSLFQHPFMAFLKDLHREYGMRITLYTYEYFGDGSIYVGIDEMPLKFRDDFRKSADWLRIGFHSPRAKFDSLVTVADFKNSYYNVNSAIAQFADSSMVASTLRLHYFFAPDSLLNALTGVRTLLCADDSNSVSYNLTASESKAVDNGGTIVKKDISYRRTDLRIDDNFGATGDLNRLDYVDTIVVFTHEWKLWHRPESDEHRNVVGKIKIQASEIVNQKLFKETVKRLNESGYGFSFLE